MKGLTFTTHDRRVGAFGAAAVLALLLGLRGLPAWRSWRAASEAAATEDVAGARRAVALVAAFPMALDSLQAREARLLRGASAYITEATPPEGASDLAALLADLARRSPIRLEAASVHVDSAYPSSLTHVSVDARATADIAGLVTFLRLVEQGPTLLAIRHLSVRPASVAGPRDQVERLAVRLTVEALVLPASKRQFGAAP